MGLIPGGDSAVNYIIEQPNRGKRSIGLDISTDEGRALLYKLVEQSDVFLTSFLPDVRQKLQDRRRAHPGREPEHRLRARHRAGPQGPDAGKGGYDGASYWARGGVANALTPKRASTRSAVGRGSVTWPAA